MVTIQIEQLSFESFGEFGSFTDMMDPTGYHLSGPCHKFFRDKILYSNNNATPVAFSALQVKKPENLIITSMEYHSYAAEVLMPLDGDVLLCLVPANGGSLSGEEAKAFLVPQGTMVALYTGVWHALPISQKEPHTNMMVVLPERTYHNDLHLADLDQPVVLQV